MVAPEKSFSRVDEWISQVIVKEWEIRKMEARVQTISESLTEKGRCERSVARIGERFKKFFFHLISRDQNQGRETVGRKKLNRSNGAGVVSNDKLGSR